MSDGPGAATTSAATIGESEVPQQWRPSAGGMVDNHGRVDSIRAEESHMGNARDSSWSANSSSVSSADEEVDEAQVLREDFAGDQHQQQNDKQLPPMVPINISQSIAGGNASASAGHPMGGLSRGLSNSTAASSESQGQQQRISLDDFERIRVLGQGSFGKVVLSRRKCSGKLYAIKTLTKQYVVKKKQVEHTRTERSVLSYMNHPFIVKLHFAFQNRDKLHFVLDFVPGGELFFHLGRAGRFSEELGRFYTAEISLALGHLHSKGVVYRDLKVSMSLGASCVLVLMCACHGLRGRNSFFFLYSSAAAVKASFEFVEFALVLAHSYFSSLIFTKHVPSLLLLDSDCI
jgi:hypothetical protein